MMDLIYEIRIVAKRDRMKSNWLKRTLMGFGWMIFMFSILFLLGGGFDSFIDFSEYGNSYTQFFVSGFMAYIVAVTGLQTGTNLIFDKDGFQKLLLVVPIRRISILFGTELMLIYFQLVYIIFIGALLLIFGTINLINMLLLYLMLIYVSTVFLSIGIWLSSLFVSRKTSEMVTGWANIVLLMLSGVMFPIKALPEIAQKIFYVNPLTYVVDVIRFLMTGQRELPLLLSITVMVIFGVVSIFFGTYMYEKNLRR